MRRTILDRLKSRAAGARQRKAFRPEALDGLEKREVLAAVLPVGFNESVVVVGLSAPQHIDIAPDGRIFVAETSGAIRVVKGGALLPTPFDVLPAVGGGLAAVTFDPDFASNHYVYAYFLTDGGGPNLFSDHLVRMTAAGDTAVPGSERLLLSLPTVNIPPGDPAHVGADIHFGLDGKLYISTGELAVPALAQQLSNPFGKLLRVNSDGTIPRDNPFYNKTVGINRAIWALGLRNPFSFAVQPHTGLIYINDVGAASWEEINRGARGANYGWSLAEGPSTDPKLTAPVYTYAHSVQPDQGTVAITGGAFYNPAAPSFPAAYLGQYFFEDYGNGWIDRLDPATGAVQRFASGLTPGTTDLDVDAQGNLYFLNNTDGTLHKISYHPKSAPTVATLTNQTATPGAAVSFQALPSGSGPFTYQWQVDGNDIAGANAASLVLPATPRFSAGRFRVTVRNAYGVATSNEATFQIDPHLPPIATILSPAEGRAYRVGQIVKFAGIASDPKAGPLPPSAFRWSLDLLHNNHVHPNTFALNGQNHGRFRVPTHGGLGDQVRYRLDLTVTDSVGRGTTVSRVIDLRN